MLRKNNLLNLVRINMYLLRFNMKHVKRTSHVVLHFMQLRIEKIYLILFVIFYTMNLIKLSSFVVKQIPNKEEEKTI